MHCSVSQWKWHVSFLFTPDGRLGSTPTIAVSSGTGVISTTSTKRDGLFIIQTLAPPLVRQEELLGVVVSILACKYSGRMSSCRRDQKMSLNSEGSGLVGLDVVMVFMPRYGKSLRLCGSNGVMGSNGEPGGTSDVQMKLAPQYGVVTLLHQRAMQSGFGRESITLFTTLSDMVRWLGVGGRLDGAGGGVGGWAGTMWASVGRPTGQGRVIMENVFVRVGSSSLHMPEASS